MSSVLQTVVCAFVGGFLVVLGYMLGRRSGVRTAKMPDGPVKLAEFQMKDARMFYVHPSEVLAIRDVSAPREEMCDAVIHIKGGDRFAIRGGAAPALRELRRAEELRQHLNPMGTRPRKAMP